MAPGGRKNNGRLVIGLLLLLSAVVGVVAYWRFIVSDRYLRADLNRLSTRGKRLSVEGCVDATVTWASRCQAMKSLCDATGPEMMTRCLAANDRTAYCARLGRTGADTHFGFKECKARHVNRKTKSACADAYRAIATYCDGLLARRDK